MRLARVCSYTVTADSGFFNPLQLQPVAALRLGFNAGARWLRENVLSHRRLINEYRLGLVLWGAHLTYKEPLGFFDTDELHVRAVGRVRRDGAQFECEVDVGSAGVVAAHLRACSIPLALSGDAALSGKPARMAAGLLAMFHADEIEPTPYVSPVVKLTREIVKDGERVGEGNRPFRLHRHKCEVADQWFWPEISALIGCGREALILSQGEGLPELRDGLRLPIQGIDMMFTRPYYLFDRGVVCSQAYRWKNRLVFVHQLLADDKPADVHAIAVERF